MTTTRPRSGLRESTDDLFSLLKLGQAAGRKVAICITTNGNIRSDGNAVMGGGPNALATKAAQHWPELPKLLAAHLRTNGNVTAELLPGVITFPTKHNWTDDSDLILIARSAQTLVEVSKSHEFVFLSRVGTANGNLPWESVKAVLDPILTDPKFRVINLSQTGSR